MAENPVVGSKKKEKWWIYYLVLAVLLVLTAGWFFYNQQQENNRIQRLQADNQKLAQDVENMKGKLATCEGKPLCPVKKKKVVSRHTVKKPTMPKPPVPMTAQSEAPVAPVTYVPAPPAPTVIRVAEPKSEMRCDKPLLRVLQDDGTVACTQVVLPPVVQVVQQPTPARDCYTDSQGQEMCRKTGAETKSNLPTGNHLLGCVATGAVVGYLAQGDGRGAVRGAVGGVLGNLGGQLIGGNTGGTIGCGAGIAVSSLTGRRRVNNNSSVQTVVVPQQVVIQPPGVISLPVVLKPGVNSLPPSLLH